MKNDFESNLQRLEEIIDTLNKGQVSLQQGLELLEEGIGLVKKCNLQLEQGKGKLSLLLEGDKGIAEWEAEELEGDIDEF